MRKKASRRADGRCPAGGRRRQEGAGPGAGADPGAARDYALRLLARPRTEHQLRMALARRGYDGAVQDEVIGRLRELGLLDDLAYARAYIGEVLTHRPAGAAVLARKLAQRGVSREHIAQALAEVGDAAGLEAARQAALAWLRRNRGHAELARLAAHLARRGFEWELVREVVAELLDKEAAGDGIPGEDTLGDEIPREESAGGDIPGEGTRRGDEL
ncbi:MAG: regulatory protein RecX [Firmicutes bacterium]|nr:regulatory protein RecX [Bacillota bacterium]